MNVYDKIFTPIMPERSRKCKAKLIDINKTGFIPKRFVKENVHFAINAIRFTKNKRGKAVLTFLGAGKAFTFGLFIEKFQNMNSGSRFLNWILFAKVLLN